jgi:signal transduction histidine kinase/DNA-binding response OmpR family regulator
MDQPKAILIASEQGPTLQEIIQTNMAECGFIVELLSEPGQLFSHLAQQPYSLLVIDLEKLDRLADTMPFFSQLRQIAPEMAILLLCSVEQRRQAVKQLEQGVAEYLLRPVEAVELVLRVERLLKPQPLKPQSAAERFQEHSGTPEALLRPRQQQSITVELSTLDEATQEIIHTLQLDKVLEIVLARARQITGASLVKVYLADRRGDLTESNPLTQPPSLANAAEEDEILFTLAQQVAFSQKIISEPALFNPTGPKPTLASILLMPMLSREKTIGVLALASKRHSVFSTHHVQWLSVFCGQAAIAIENACLFQDLSAAYIDLAQSREKILHSRNTLQVVFDGITDGLYILNRDLTIHTLNRVEAQRQGYKPKQLIGQSYLALGWPKTAPQLLDQIKESLKTGRETTWISPENESDPYLKDREFRIYPIRNRAAQTQQVVVFAQDVSERRRWQASLFRSANLAAVGQLAGSVAHQINNPLTVTMTNSQLLMLDTDPKSELHDLASGIFKAGERIQNIVTNLLEFSNQERYFFVQADLIETIEGALALVVRSLEKAQIKLIKDYQVRPMLSASVSHLKLVWINLLLNARDAVTDHAKQPQITISTRAISEREVKVAITDNGVGVTEKEMEQLFRPFFTTKPTGKGLGLGLYSAHAIIERHHGTIKASSQPGLATTFEVMLPLDNPRDL